MRTQIRLQKATNRDTPCHWIVIGRLSVLISYETPVAFSLVTMEVPFRQLQFALDEALHPALPTLVAMAA